MSLMWRSWPKGTCSHEFYRPLRGRMSRISHYDTIQKHPLGRASARSLKQESFNPLGEPMDSTMKAVYDSVIARDPNQPEFHQAVEEVLDSLVPVIQANPEYLTVVEAIVEAERIIQFRVPWYDDDGNFHVNRGF